jgi:hypothetical protein
MSVPQAGSVLASHINIRYFFVADRVPSGEVSIEYCPTGKMVANFFTRPLEGSPFQKLWDSIMNVDPSDKSLVDHSSVLRNKEMGATTNRGSTDEKVRRTDEKVRLGREPHEATLHVEKPIRKDGGK